ncbi:helix-turn-helix domain-containing protein [Pseudoflavonifractor sp.]|jgi:transcriptional regulator with XRE-family HTH domain|uniref:helix-turn-helix domain-containing protein n=1 Tax=Pseudoflavonifractor sp. TaxID=1980281 RepID=UPI003D9261F1
MKLYRYRGKANLCGRQVRRLRVDLGLSQEQLAARLQVAGLALEQKAVSRIETGIRVVADFELLALAAALNTSPLALLDEDKSWPAGDTSVL